MRLLTIDEVVKRTALSMESIINNADDGNFPGPVQLFDEHEAWVESEVEAWIRDSIEDRDINNGCKSIWSFGSYGND